MKPLHRFYWPSSTRSRRTVRQTLCGLPQSWGCGIACIMQQIAACDSSSPNDVYVWLGRHHTGNRMAPTYRMYNGCGRIESQPPSASGHTSISHPTTTSYSNSVLEHGIPVQLQPKGSLMAGVEKHLYQRPWKRAANLSKRYSPRWTKSLIQYKAALDVIHFPGFPSSCWKSTPDLLCNRIERRWPLQVDLNRQSCQNPRENSLWTSPSYIKVQSTTMFTALCSLPFAL